MKPTALRSVLILGLLVTAGCSEPGQPPAPEATTTARDTARFSIPFDTFTLDNGLKVIFHLDRSDPVTAVVLTSHVGSARELPGRTGFAHLFEHLLFLESENLGRGGLDQMSARIGGSGANGSTSRDRTNYFQTVPNDALEKMLWAEADKLGYFINTVTEPVLAKEKQVVKNEKRQGVDNQPYGHNQFVIDRALYPGGHPYSWQVIGSLDDLDQATLDDVKNFFRQWYTPNNVTLTIAGDFDPDQARAWVHHYFDEIPRGPEISRQPPQPAALDATVSLFHEDNYATQPLLTYTWPGVPLYHPDSYALQVLGKYLSEGKEAPFNEVLIDERQLTAEVFIGDYNSELAGQVILETRAFAGIDLDAVAAAFAEAFARFEAEGMDEADLDRIKAGQETEFYLSLGSALGKAFQLAQYDVYTGDPGFVSRDIDNILAVTLDDVMRVYRTYLKDRPFVATSFVPRGETALALEGARRAEVVEEPIVPGAEDAFDLSGPAAYERTPSSFDRTLEPAYGEPPQVAIPDVWQAVTGNGIGVYGIENDEVPLVVFDLRIDGGQLLDATDKIGAANLLGELLNRGTANRTPAELEQAIENLGATITVEMEPEALHVRGRALARNSESALALAVEMLLQPRFDAGEFAIAKRRTLDEIQERAANPLAIADREFARLVYGPQHRLSTPAIGTEESVTALSLDDLRDWYAANLSPRLASFHVVGAIPQATLMATLDDLLGGWQADDVVVPDYPLPETLAASRLYFYDVPGASQSVFRFGSLALPATDPDYYPAVVMNYRLGGGGFASQLTQEVREGKGYTYNINSGFAGSRLPGPFRVASGVRANVTFEAAALVRDLLANYAAGFGETDMEVTRNYMLKSQARAFETLDAKLAVLQNMSAYGWPSDYAREREAIVRAMTVSDIQALAREYIDPNRMIYLVVGDARTQLQGLSALGVGEPVLLNP